MPRVGANRLPDDLKSDDRMTPRSVFRQRDTSGTRLPITPVVIAESLKSTSKARMPANMTRVLQKG